MGKLLQDDKKILEDYGIGLSGNDTFVVHLFPKTNVVINNDNDNNTNAKSDEEQGGRNTDDANGNSHGGAHVPQIIIDRNELLCQGQVLILSSHEAYETMHRVRLFSFLLLAYSTLQILCDVTIYLAPQEGIRNSDDIIPPVDPTDTQSSVVYEEPEELQEAMAR